MQGKKALHCILVNDHFPIIVIYIIIDFQATNLKSPDVVL